MEFLLALKAQAPDAAHGVARLQVADDDAARVGCGGGKLGRAVDGTPVQARGLGVQAREDERAAVSVRFASEARADGDMSHEALGLYASGSAAQAARMSASLNPVALPVAAATVATPFPAATMPSGFPEPSPCAKAASSSSASRCPSSSPRYASKLSITSSSNSSETIVFVAALWAPMLTWAKVSSEAVTAAFSATQEPVPCAVAVPTGIVRP